MPVPLISQMGNFPESESVILYYTPVKAVAGCFDILSYIYSFFLTRLNKGISTEARRIFPYFSLFFISLPVSSRTTLFLQSVTPEKQSLQVFQIFGKHAGYIADQCLHPPEQPRSPPRANNANIAVPPFRMTADALLKLPGHIIPTDRPQIAHPSRDSCGSGDREISR